MADSEHHDNGHDDYDLVHENEVNEAGFTRQRTKSETLAELRRKEQGQKVPLTKVDYTSHLRKTNKTEASSQGRKTSDDSPKYLQQLRKAETGVETKPMYVRMRQTNGEESESKAPEKKFTSEELMSMAFKKADDAEQRDPALRRGILSKPASASPGTFQGLQVTSNEKEDYRAALKQHVKVEPKTNPKAHDNKPSWANIQPKRVLDMDIKSRPAKENNKQDAPEWAQQTRGVKKNMVGLGSGKPQEKTKAPEWANLVNRTDRRKIIELEHKRNPLQDSKQPEWASKPKDAREILRVENRRKQVSTDDQPDYRGALRKGNRKE